MVKLSREAQQGSTYAADLEKPVLRAEASRHCDLVRTTVAEVNQSVEKPLEMWPAGSYSRSFDGLSLEEIGKSAFGKLLPLLKEKGYVVESLAGGQVGNHQWRGLVRLPGVGDLVRRLDLFLTMRSELPTALWYYTGSASFTRAVELRAVRTGHYLNVHGLWRLRVDSEGQLRVENVPLKLAEQHDICRALGIQWMDPPLRSSSALYLVDSASPFSSLASSSSRR